MSESKDAADRHERAETDEYENLELLAKLRTWFENAEDASAEARAAAEMARDYYDGEQLTEEEIAALKARGQPIMVANRIKPKINYLRGMEKKSRMDPKAYPRNPGDEEAAQAATDSLRYVVDAEVFDQTASMVWDNQLIEGFGGSDVIVEDDGERGPRIRVIHYRWDRLFYDPHSSLADFDDAKFKGGVIWADEDDIEADWPDADENAIKGAYEYADTASGKTFDDKPRGSTWADYKRKRLRVIQMHWTKGREWWLATFTAGGFLSKPAKSPYLDERGQPECSLIMQSGYVDRNNNRYGAVKDMIGPQDEINKRRSKALHLLTMRQVVAEQGAVQDVESARAELAKPDGYIEIAPQSKFEVVQTSDLAAGQFQLLQEAKSELEAVGPNATMQGRQGGSASGRAIALTQQGGAIEVDGALLDQHLAGTQLAQSQHELGQLRGCGEREPWFDGADCATEECAAGAGDGFAGGGRYPRRRRGVGGVGDGGVGDEGASDPVAEIGEDAVDVVAGVEEGPARPADSESVIPWVADRPARRRGRHGRPVGTVG